MVVMLNHSSPKFDNSLQEPIVILCNGCYAKYERSKWHTSHYIGQAYLACKDDILSRAVLRFLAYYGFINRKYVSFFLNYYHHRSKGADDATIARFYISDSQIRVSHNERANSKKMGDVMSKVKAILSTHKLTLCVEQKSIWLSKSRCYNVYY